MSRAVCSRDVEMQNFTKGKVVVDGVRIQLHEVLEQTRENVAAKIVWL